MNNYEKLFCVLIMIGVLITGCSGQKKIKKSDPVAGKEKIGSSFKPGAVWQDESGEVINAHGGGILYMQGTYYWFGEKRGKRASEGVNVYSSKDLYHWKFENLALSQSPDTTSDIAVGCLIERPKVIYNAKTKKYVMWFHLELRGQGYKAARAGVAVSDKVTGPYQFLSSFRPNDNMSRDMTLFVDDDGKAYHIYSSRENYDMRIVQLSDDYTAATTKDKMLFSEHREAPAIFKYNKKYYLITSGCTGWAPNKASIHVADSLFGEWTSIGNPLHGSGADSTYGGQSGYILPVAGKQSSFIFMADKWNPRDLKDSRYLWLPIEFREGKPFIDWKDEWQAIEKPVLDQLNGYKLVWSDEFNKDGAPDSTRWDYEKGFVRNGELQWYQLQNAYCKKGKLIIEARRETKPNPNYVKDSRDWRQNRPDINYTSACLITKGKQDWQYGRFEMRARIDISAGMWPAWWTLGVTRPWPANGEIDIMEYYKGKLLANIACFDKSRGAEWHSNRFSVDSLGADWASKFHVWRMDWTKEYLVLYVDDQVLNKVAVDSLYNKDGSNFNPFRQPHYQLLNLAIGGQNGGGPSNTAFPRRFEIDYVRVYQKQNEALNN